MVAHIRSLTYLFFLYTCVSEITLWSRETVIRHKRGCVIGSLALAFRKLHAAIWLLAVRPIGKYRQGTCQSANGSWSHGPTTLHGYIATS